MNERERVPRPPTGKPAPTISATVLTKQPDPAQGNPQLGQDTLPKVRGFAAPPAGRRRLWALVVPRCPECGFLHLHRSTGAHGGRRTGSCGRDYVVVLAGNQRGRWGR